MGRVACISGFARRKSSWAAWKKPKRLAELALAGRAPPEDVEREAQGGEIPAPGAVPDLGGVGSVGLQDLDGGAVLLEVLRRQVLEMDLDDGHEAGKGLDDLLGGPKRPLDKAVHAGSLQLSFKD